MPVKEAIETVNEMVATGVISRYAIGGAIGATFYLEPFSTFDIDFFVAGDGVDPKSLNPFSTIYKFLTDKGAVWKGEHITLHGWQLQFLPVSEALDREALEQAVQTDVQGVPARVMRSEHLMALALRLGRPKDYLRLNMFRDFEAYDPDILDEILARHGLSEKWAAFVERKAQ